MFLVAKTPTPEARNEMPYALSGPLRKIIKVVFVALIALVIIVYSYFQTKNLDYWTGDYYPFARERKCFNGLIDYT